jgi:hypothetical protein
MFAILWRIFTHLSLFQFGIVVKEGGVGWWFITFKLFRLSGTISGCHKCFQHHFKESHLLTTSCHRRSIVSTFPLCSIFYVHLIPIFFSHIPFCGICQSSIRWRHLPRQFVDYTSFVLVHFRVLWCLARVLPSCIFPSYVEPSRFGLLSCLISLGACYGGNLGKGRTLLQLTFNICIFPPCHKGEGA